jgi:membrane protease YdiL (CAAX protease family)
MTPFFEDNRETTGRVLLLAIVAFVGTTALLNFVFGQTGVREALDAVKRTTGGLVQGPLIAGPLVFVVVGAVIFGVGRLRCSDVGWRLPDIGLALLVTLVFWVAMQAGLVLWVVGSGGQLQWNEVWNEPGAPGWLFGQLIAQLLGNALLEEMVFRGYFLPQFYLKALARFRPAAALLLALLVSQIFFALSHIPNRLFVNVYLVHVWLGDQLGLLLLGLTFSVLYLVTRNLFVCVGLHSLYNQPVRLPAVPFSPGVKTVWYALVLILLVVWLVAGRFGTKRRMPINEDKPVIIND